MTDQYKEADKQMKEMDELIDNFGLLSSTDQVSQSVTQNVSGAGGDHSSGASSNVGDKGQSSGTKGTPSMVSSGSGLEGGPPPPEKGANEFNEFKEEMGALRAAMSVPLFGAVTTFNGDPRRFKQWVQEVERYGNLTNQGDQELAKTAHLTAMGSVADFIKRYLDERVLRKEAASWKNLKGSLRYRFGEIIDSQQAMALLRSTRQYANEPVQVFAERFLRTAEDAFPPDKRKGPLREYVLQQLADMFTDGLYHNYLRMCVLKRKPKTFDTALDLALGEQNLRARFNMRAAPVSSVPLVDNVNPYNNGGQDYDWNSYPNSYTAVQTDVRTDNKGHWDDRAYTNLLTQYHNLVNVGGYDDTQPHSTTPTPSMAS